MQEWPPLVIWVPPTQAQVLWVKSAVSFVPPPVRFPCLPIPLFLRATCPKGLKSSLSENASLGFILIASPATNHISSCFNLRGGGMKNGPCHRSPVSVCGNPLAFGFCEVFSAGTVNSSPLLVVRGQGLPFLFTGEEKV